MPKFLGQKVAVTKDELVPDFHPTENALSLKLYRDEKRGFGYKRLMRGGNCRELLIDFDSLPKKITQYLIDPRKPEHALENYYKVSREISNYYNDYQYPDGGYLLDDAIEKYIINASVLTALTRLEAVRISERIKMSMSTKGIVTSLYDDAHSFNGYLLPKYDTKHTLNSNLRSFKRQYKSFKEENLYSVIIDPLGKRRTNALVRDEKIESLLESMFAGVENKPNATKVADQYNAFLAGYVDVINNDSGEVYNPKEYKVLEKSTITRFLASWNSKIGTHAKRSGDRQQLMQEFIPYHDLEIPKFSGSIISIDDRQPPFYYNEAKKRMWWYIGIDLASGAVIAWAFGKTKKEMIVNFYRNLVQNCHKWNVPVPDGLECESSLNSSFKDTFLRNGTMFQDVQIHPNSARSKRIERHFREFRYELEKEQEGWVARPFAKSESNQASAEVIKVIPYARQVQQHFGNIETWNNMPNNQDESISRFDYFLQRQHPDLKETNYRSFIKDLGVKTTSSCNAGQIKLQSANWLLGDKGEIYTGNGLIRLLRQVEAQTIDIYWLDDDEGNIYKAMIFDCKDGRYIGEALPKPKGARAHIERTAAHAAATDILSRYQITVSQYMQSKKNAIEKVTVIDERSKTISSSFSIAGANKFTPREQPVDDLGEMAEDDFNYTPKEHHAQGLDRAF